MKKNKAFLSFILYAVSIAMILVASWHGKNVPFEKQWPLFESLRTTASIIFAVVGAWIAIVYPERLKLSFGEKGGVAEGSAGTMAKLFSPIVHSTLILCMILVVGIVAPILKTFSSLLEYREELRGISYGLLVTLTLWQLWTIILTLIPADIVRAAADREHHKRKLYEGYMSQTQKEDD